MKFLPTPLRRLWMIVRLGEGYVHRGWRCWRSGLSNFMISKCITWAVRGKGDVVVQSVIDATRVSAFSEVFTEAVIGGEVTQVAARRLPM